MKKMIAILVALSAGLAVMMMAVKPAKAAATYTISSARHYNSRVVTSARAKFWQAPYETGVKNKGRATKLTGKLLQLNQVAKSQAQTYFQVSRRGHNYGWINAKSLKLPATYNLPLTYTSQLYPLNAPNGCEGASLKMALSVKGIALHTSLKTILNKMPKTKSPKTGFNGTPYKESPNGKVWTIYPQPLAKYARRYDRHSADISGATKAQLIREVKRGNAVVVASAWNMQAFRPYHVVALVGYRSGHFKIADPYMQRSWSHKIYWTTTSKFMAVYKTRHQRAVVVR